MQHRWHNAFAIGALMVGLIAGAMPAGAHGEHPPTGDESGTASHKNVDLLFESGGTGATNSDMAFWGNYAYVGNYLSLRIYDISTTPPTLVSDTPCDGPQNDVSVWDRDGDGFADILFLSVDQVMEGPECGAARTPASQVTDPGKWEGIRIFDVSDPAAPTQIGDVYQDCGSHTHTIVPDPEDDRVLLYNSSYPLRSGPTCGPGSAAADPLHSRIQVVEVSWDGSDPLNNALVSAGEIAEPPVVYPGDPDGTFDPCDAGGVLCEPAFNDLTACHDIGVFMPKLIAGAACAEQAQLWRIDPDTLLPDTANPIWVYDDEEDVDGPGGGDVSVDFWHSASFSWDGKVVSFVDESFGFTGGCPTVTDNQDPEGTVQGLSDTGAYFFLSVSSGMKFSHIQPPTRLGQAGAYCSAHLGNSVLTPGRNLLVTASYNGGAEVYDYTAPKQPKVIAWWDYDSPASNNWSHYWYETDPKPGTAFTSYGNDIGRGFQQFSVNVGIGRRLGLDHLNPQTQEVMIK